MLLSVLTTIEAEDVEEDDDPKEMLIIDVRRAHFYARALRRVFIGMPREDPRWKEGEGQCGGVWERSLQGGWALKRPQ